MYKDNNLGRAVVIIPIPYIKQKHALCGCCRLLRMRFRYGMGVEIGNAYDPETPKPLC